MDWFYAEQGKQAGPVDDTGLTTLVAEGRVRPETLVWRPGMAEWRPYAGLEERRDAGPQIGLVRCSQCGRDYLPDDIAMFGPTPVCANCKPIFVQKLLEGVLPFRRMPFANVWIRWGAVMIDGVILYVIGMIIAGVGFGLFSFSLSNMSAQNLTAILVGEGLLGLSQMAVSIGYETFFIGRLGATPGKLVCRIQVVRSDGGKLSYKRAAARWFAKILNQFTIGIGYLMAFFDEERCALHDRICDTRVVEKR